MAKQMYLITAKGKNIDFKLEAEKAKLNGILKRLSSVTAIPKSVWAKHTDGKIKTTITIKKL